MKREEVNEKLDNIQENLEELKEAEWDDFSVYSNLADASSRVRTVKKTINTPEKPETCEGFIGNCENKPSEYSKSRDVWLCASCYNELYRHYAR